MAVPLGGLLLSSLIPTPSSIHLQLGWEPMAVLWGGLLFSSLNPTPPIPHLHPEAQDPRASNKEMEKTPYLEEQKPGPLLCLSVVIAIVDKKIKKNNVIIFFFSMFEGFLTASAPRLI